MSESDTTDAMPYMTLEEAGAKYGRAASTLRVLATQGKLRTVKRGGIHWTTDAWMDAYLSQLQPGWQVRKRRRQISDAVEASGASLTAREREVMTLRYGLAGGRALTLGSVAEQLGISRERVRQLEAAALMKLDLTPTI